MNAARPRKASMSKPGADAAAQDAAVCAQFHARSADFDFPPGLAMQWLGTAGFKFSYQGYTILIDPYFTRSSMKAIASRKALQPDDRSVAGHVDRCDAVLVGHTHFDHALDVYHLSVTALRHLRERGGAPPEAWEGE